MPPRQARSGPRNQRYYEINGERYWSVTTITKGGLPEGYGLAKWKRTAVAEGAVRCIQDGTLPKLVEMAPDAAVSFLADLPFQKTKRAADVGSEVHAQIEALVTGAPAPDPSDDAAPFLAQFALFLQEYEPRFLLAEATVFHRDHWYAGTLDAVVEIDGLRFLFDVKTGGVWPEVALQLAAYRNAQWISLPSGREPMLETETDVALVLDLKPDGYRLREVFIGDPVYRAFLYCRETFRWDQEVSRKVLRGDHVRASTDPVKLEAMRLREKEIADREKKGPVRLEHDVPALEVNPHADESEE